MMINNNQTGIHFGAMKICSATILNKRNNKPFDTNIVKLDCNDLNDIQLLKQIAQTWEKNYYIQRILEIAELKAKKDAYYTIYDIYAMTKQEDKFEKLNSKDILGVMDIEATPYENVIFLDHIETNPQYALTQKDRDLCKVGRILLDFLKERFRKIELIARNSIYVEEFYKSCGFIEESNWKGFFYWEKK